MIDFLLTALTILGLALLVIGAAMTVFLVLARLLNPTAWHHGRHCADDVLDPHCPMCQRDTPRGRRLRGQQ